MDKYEKTLSLKKQFEASVTTDNRGQQKSKPWSEKRGRQKTDRGWTRPERRFNRLEKSFTLTGENELKTEKQRTC